MSNSRRWWLLQGDCVEVMARLKEGSVHAIVTDPPYGIEFMSKDWDDLGSGRRQEEWHRRWAVQALRVLRPGGYAAVFGGTRTFHRLTSGLEDAGFEIRDVLCWHYGQGFPKNHDVSKAIDKSAGAERKKKRVEYRGNEVYRMDGANTRPWMEEAIDKGYHELDGDEPATENARRWDGYGTALKPGWEPIVLVRKPFKTTVAANVVEHGTGALNVDGCRIETTDKVTTHSKTSGAAKSKGAFGDYGGVGTHQTEGQKKGRWPANVVLVHSPDCDEECVPGCPVAELDRQSGVVGASAPVTGAEPTADGFSGPVYGSGKGRQSFVKHDGRSGGASRFFYTAKASNRERWGYCKTCDVAFCRGDKVERAKHPTRGDGKHDVVWHPTVKPLELMKWLVRLVGGQPGSLILDPFAGTATTGVAALEEGFRVVLVEREDNHSKIARARMEAT